MPLIIIIAIFLTIKFNPKWLTDFLGITDAQGGVSDLISYIELMIEFGFLYFVLKEFKMTRESFEWQEEEHNKKEEKEIDEKIEYFALTCLGVLKLNIRGNIKDNKIKLINDLLKKEKDKQEYKNWIYDDICNFINSKTNIPFDFCKYLIDGTIYTFKIDHEHLDAEELYTYINNIQDRILLKQDFFKPIVKKKLRNFFTSNKQIENLYNKLTSSEIDSII